MESPDNLLLKSETRFGLLINNLPTVFYFITTFLDVLPSVMTLMPFAVSAILLPSIVYTAVALNVSPAVSTEPTADVWSALAALLSPPYSFTACIRYSLPASYSHDVAVVNPSTLPFSLSHSRWRMAQAAISAVRPQLQAPVTHTPR